MTSYRLPDKKSFEHFINGKPTHLLILRNKRGMAVAFTDYGARVVSLLVPDRSGNMVDVVLGFPSIQGYLGANEVYHGTTVGRYANRIAGGKFQLGGKEYHIPLNNGQNALHGGPDGFDKKVWDRRISRPDCIEFYLVSPDGDQGFPGTLTVTVSYTLTDENELLIKYRAQTDQTTVVNLTNHAFFNLNGEGAEPVDNHLVHINAKAYLPVDENQIPMGGQQEVAGTDFDFRRPRSLEFLNSSSDPQITAAGGIDHNYVLSTSGQFSEIAARVTSPLTGIAMEVRTSEPGLQLYTGNFLNGRDSGKTGRSYQKHGSLCLESQKFPDTPNRKDYPTCLLSPSELYLSQTSYKFSVEK